MNGLVQEGWKDSRSDPRLHDLHEPRSLFLAVLMTASTDKKRTDVLDPHPNPDFRVKSQKKTRVQEVGANAATSSPNSTQVD